MDELDMVLLVENRVARVATVMFLYKVDSRNKAGRYIVSTHFPVCLLSLGTDFVYQRSQRHLSRSANSGNAFNAEMPYDGTNYFETVPSDPRISHFWLDNYYFNSTFFNIVGKFGWN